MSADYLESGEAQVSGNTSAKIISDAVTCNLKADCEEPSIDVDVDVKAPQILSGALAEEEESSMCSLFGGDVTQLPQEDDDGACEYKLKLCNPTPERFTHLVTQLMFRLREGQGECLYEIGVQDDGLVCGLSEEELEMSLDTLDRMAEEADAYTFLLRKRKGSEDSTLIAAEILVRKRVAETALLDLRVAVAGNVDSGKSTLVGVLTTGINDNGRGQARAAVTDPSLYPWD